MSQRLTGEKRCSKYREAALLPHPLSPALSCCGGTERITVLLAWHHLPARLMQEVYLKIRETTVNTLPP
jgi:hypothetical protein